MCVLRPGPKSKLERNGNSFQLLLHLAKEQLKRPKHPHSMNYCALVVRLATEPNIYSATASASASSPATYFSGRADLNSSLSALVAPAAVGST